jgi:hypothetical protein
VLCWVVQGALALLRALLLLLWWLLLLLLALVLLPPLHPAVAATAACGAVC